MSDEQLAETIQRFLAGESLEAIARSQGLPWNPPSVDFTLPQVSDEDLREGIRRFLVSAEEEATTPVALEADEVIFNLEGISDAAIEESGG